MRSCWRHEQQSTRMVLAMVSHHSLGKVDTAHDAPRRPEDSHQDETAGAHNLSLDDVQRHTQGALSWSS